MSAEELDDFRSEVRAWLEDNCPESMRTPMTLDEVPSGGRFPSQNPDTDVWMRRAAERGFTLPNVPVEYGGAGLSAQQVKVLNQEMVRIGARPPLLGSGISLLVPTLLRFGTEEQKKQHIPLIARGEVLWCQGFSEPEAGSDLPSLRMSAVRDGSDFVLNGQKTWTSFATRADWMFVLVRTDPTARKREGISMLLVDMASPGLTVRPVRQINGDDEFCESFFDDVRVPVDNVLGELNDGWNVAKYLLRAEREDVRPWVEGTYSYPVVDLWQQAPRTEPELWLRLVNNELDRLGLDALMLRAAAAARSGDQRAERFASVVKVIHTEYQQERADLSVSLRGRDGLCWRGEGVAKSDLDLTRSWLTSRAFTIAGGSTEIQLNTISRQWLELPTS
ncbi:acyl-CoA dehydrogenase family protein [Mycobacterium kyogaense]|uniref:acyl-CoA dehydrogenase family protein n=1 Tax=Mycobacterium kyogaense TaxID=2212479 RepID=UPI000DAD02F2|nr:acyl-CoA dehydrogenase family protein [Mycobacterium kyogaense]